MATGNDAGGQEHFRFWVGTLLSIIGTLVGILAWDDFKSDRQGMLCRVGLKTCEAPRPPEPGPLEPWRLRSIPNDVLERIGRPGTQIEDAEQILGDRPVFIAPDQSYRVYEGGLYRVVLSDFSEGASGHTVYHTIRLVLAEQPDAAGGARLSWPLGRLSVGLGRATFGDVHAAAACRRVTLWNNDGKAACSNKIELECGPVEGEEPLYVRPGILADCPSYHEGPLTRVNPAPYEMYPLLNAAGNPGRSTESAAVREEMEKFMSSTEVDEAVFNYVIVSDHRWSVADDDDP